jgi:ParB-like chromosome segregation protein Spo0J
MLIEHVPLDRVSPHPRNPRQGDVGAIAVSIERFGLYQPIVVQRSTGYILAGNHRWMAAAALGLDEVPVVWLDVDDITAEAIMLADNRTAELATWDDAALLDLLSELRREDALEGVGWDDEDIEALRRTLAEDRPLFTDWHAIADQAVDLLRSLTLNEEDSERVESFIATLDRP